MTTLRQPVKVRRAKGTDVVNIYRLLAAEHEQHYLVPVDEVLALGSVLTVIENGHVGVAEHSGRIVGSIGFRIYHPQYSREPILDMGWFVVVPAYKETSVGLALLRNALKAADQYDPVIRISVGPVPGEKRITSQLKALGFAPTATTWIRPRKKADGDADEHTNENGVPPASGDAASGGGDTGSANN